MNLSSRACSYLIACLSLAVLVGCGGGDKVSGTVEFEDGTKLTSGDVTFIGETFEEAGIIGSDGTYELEQGLPAGDYVVTVEAFGEPGGEVDTASYNPDGKPLVHSEYSDSASTPLKYTSPGTSPFNIKVKKP